jgi:hypothetical protein
VTTEQETDMMRRLTWLTIPLVLLLLGCSSSLSRYSARKILLKTPELELSKEDVDLIDVVQTAQDRAVVEANINLGFLLIRTGQEWSVSEVRLADRKWVKIEDMQQALTDLRWLETHRRLLQLAQGLLSYRSAMNAFPPKSDIVTLTDLLMPRYMPQLVRTDAWGRELLYEPLSRGARFKLTSAGPDGKFTTADDLVLVDSRLVSPAVAQSAKDSAGD